MDSADSSQTASAAVRYVFATVFVAACLYNLELGVRVAGVFLLGLSLVQGFRGKVPLIGITWKTSGYLTGMAAVAVCAVVAFVSVFFVLEPRAVIAFVAATHH